MSDTTFQALMARKSDQGAVIALERITMADLPEADVTIDVAYSSFNYKDGLALTGRSRILRTFPMVPGIDFSGVVSASQSPRFRVGDRVALTGWGVGEGWSGGFAERARVKSEWLVKLPETISNRHAMAIGTAGLTAMLCILALQEHGIRDGGDVLVTGAAGGVGSVAVRLLSRLAYRVSALTGRRSEEAFLRSFGASDILDRQDLSSPGKPLQNERWAGAVDVAAGAVLGNVIASMAYGGAVAMCGLAGGTEVSAAVFPFILRNVALLGVDSVMCPLERREAAWQSLAAELSEADLEPVVQEVGLKQLPVLAQEILGGRVRGRTVVDVRR